MPDEQTLVYDPELGPGYFVQIRADFLRWPHFSPTAKVLYLVLCSYAGEGVSAWPGQGTLAEQCGVSENPLREALAELKAAGLLTVKRRGQGLTNLYHVHKLKTLPPKRHRASASEPQNQRFRAEAQNLRFRKRSTSGSSAAESAEELHTVEIHTEKVEDKDAGEQERETGPAPRYSAWIAAVVTDFSRELADLANVAGNVERALRIWQAGGGGEEAFVARLQAARAETRKAQARGVANKMQYLLRVLSDE